MLKIQILKFLRASSIFESKNMPSILVMLVNGPVLDNFKLQYIGHLNDEES